MPKSCAILSTSASHSRSRNARPDASPLDGKLSKSFTDASFTVFSVISADSPPITMAKWYGGHAEVPREVIFSVRKARSESGFRSALVCWYKKVLFAEPPPNIYIHVH